VRVLVFDFVEKWPDLSNVNVPTEATTRLPPQAVLPLPLRREWALKAIYDVALLVQFRAVSPREQGVR